MTRTKTSFAEGQLRQMEWRICPLFPQYEVSESGDVRRGSLKNARFGGRLKGCINQDGYLFYQLVLSAGKVGVTAHRLVIETFIGPAPTPNHEVAHNDGSRVNNHFTNLRWATRAENHADMIVHGTGLKGERNGRAVITESDVVYIRHRYREIKVLKLHGGELQALTDKYGLCRAHIIRIAKGFSWTNVPMPNPDFVHSGDGVHQ